MMIPVYKAEAQAGLADLVRSTASVAYATNIEIFKPSDLDKQIAQAKLTQAVATNEGSFDLYYLKCIMASVGWNLNDDIFDIVSTWLARHSPEDKPFNLEHDPRRVRGHITGSYIINEKGERLADNLTIDELPDKYHVVANSVLYRFLKSPDKDLTKEMEDTIKEIEEAKWYVSMECLFANFDYGIITPDNKMLIIPRNEDSAFLTKHLRAYGGVGSYDNHKIGRILRDITFSGKGLVRRPANPESIIFNEVAMFKPSMATLPKEFSQLITSAGYNSVSDNASHSTQKESSIMADTNVQVDVLNERVKSLEATVTAATKKNEEYEKRLAESNEKQVKAQIDELTAKLKEKDDKVVSLAAQVKTEQEARQTAEAKVKEAAEQLTVANTELGKLKAEQVKASRITQWVERTGVEVANATKSVEKLMKLGDDEFKDFLETQPAKAATQTAAELEAKKKADEAAVAAEKKKALDAAQANKNEPPMNSGGVDNLEESRAALGNYIGKHFLRVGKKKQTEGAAK